MLATFFWSMRQVLAGEPVVNWGGWKYPSFGICISFSGNRLMISGGNGLGEAYLYFYVLVGTEFVLEETQTFEFEARYCSLNGEAALVSYGASHGVHLIKQKGYPVSWRSDIFLDTRQYTGVRNVELTESFAFVTAFNAVYQNTLLIFDRNERLISETQNTTLLSVFGDEIALVCIRQSYGYAGVKVYSFLNSGTEWSIHEEIKSKFHEDTGSSLSCSGAMNQNFAFMVGVLHGTKQCPWCITPLQAVWIFH